MGLQEVGRQSSKCQKGVVFPHTTPSAYDLQRLAHLATRASSLYQLWSTSQHPQGTEVVVFTWDASGLELASRFDRLPQNHAMKRQTFDCVPSFATLDTELDTQPHRKAAEAWGGAITARCFVEC